MYMYVLSMVSKSITLSMIDSTSILASDIDGRCNEHLNGRHFPRTTWIKSYFHDIPPISVSPYTNMHPSPKRANAKGIKAKKKSENENSTHASIAPKAAHKPPNKNADQHLAFTFHPLSLILAANTKAAPSRAHVDAHACGATYLPPSAACSAPPIGLSNRVSTSKFLKGPLSFISKLTVQSTPQTTQSQTPSPTSCQPYSDSASDSPRTSGSDIGRRR